MVKIGSQKTDNACSGLFRDNYIKPSTSCWTVNKSGVKAKSLRAAASAFLSHTIPIAAIAALAPKLTVAENTWN